MKADIDSPYTITKKVIIYSQGIVAISVCVSNDLSKKEIEDEVNRVSPTGISSRWAISTDTHFKGGETNPCPCETHTETRKHYLLNC